MDFLDPGSRPGQDASTQRHGESQSPSPSPGPSPNSARDNNTPAPAPAWQPDAASLPPPVYRSHLRTPSGLSLNTDLHPADAPSSPSADLAPDTTPPARRPSASASAAAGTAPIAIQQGLLRSAWSAASLGSLSPGSALSSPALNALGDLTPLPSPLVMSDSPGPWTRRPRSRGASTGSRDDGGVVFGKSAVPAVSGSGSLKKKGYSWLKAGIESSSAQNEAACEKSRSLSEYTPNALHNARPRHVTIGNVAAEIDGGQHMQQHLHREAYLAAQRGLVSASNPAGLPTPPASNASNASNRSVTDTEEDDTPEDPTIRYITVREGPDKAKTFWRPVRQLGQGTFSKVYLATSERVAAKDPLDEASLDPHKLVAIKVVEHGPAGGADEERVELSLKREVEMLRSVSHPSLVHLQAFDHSDAQALIVLSYCPGGDLFDVASEHRDILTPDVVQRIFAEMVGAVAYLHSELIVHRDIKLENILLNLPPSRISALTHPQSHPTPLATLTDLGLSRRIPAPPASPLLTTRCGSEDYAAPEILLGQPYDGRATDAWALGVLLYALIEGRLPFDAMPGKAGARQGRAAHRIARCEWGWVRCGDEEGSWDERRAGDWRGAREVVEGVLRKVSRGRKGVGDLVGMEWVRRGIVVEGGLRRAEDMEGKGSTES